MTARKGLVAVTAIFLLRWWIGLNYSLSVPVWEAYDEPNHFSYVVTLATTERLPTKDDATRNPEAIQPPLYYALMATLLRVSGTDVTGYQPPERNPQFYANNGSVNYALHRSQLTRNTQASETALHYLRLVTLLITLIAVASAYRLFRLIGTQRLALVMLLVFALWPQALFNGSMVTNDALTLTLGTVLTWLMVRALQVGLTVRNAALILLLIGLGTLVKLNLLLMLVPFGVLSVFATRRRSMLIIGAVYVAVASVVVLSSVPGVLLPFNAMNAQGEPMLTAIWHNLTHDRGWTLVPDGLRYLMYSSFGLFGWGNVALPSSVQVLIVLLLGAAVMGGVVGLVRRRWSRQTLLLGTIVIAQMAGGTVLMLFYQTIHLLNGRYLLPALSAMCILLVGGWSALGARIGRTILVLVVSGLLIAGIAIPPYIASVYARPAAVMYTETEHRPHEFQSGMRLVGYSVAQSESDNSVVSVSLYWSATRLIADDYFVRLAVIGADDNGYGLFDTIPGRGNHPTTNWIPDEVFRDDYRVPIRADAPLGKAHIRLTVVAIQNPKDTVSFDLDDAPFDVWVLR